MIKYKEEPAFYFESIIVFLVVSIAFILSSSLLSVGGSEGMLKQALIFSCVVSVSIILARYLLASFIKRPMVALPLMLRNFVGLLVALVLMLVIRKFLDLGIDSIAGLILASVISFFVLGTIVPLIKSGRTRST